MFPEQVLDEAYEEKDFTEQMDYYIRWRMADQMKQLKMIQDKKTRRLEEQRDARPEDYNRVYKDKRFAAQHCFDADGQLVLMNVIHEGPAATSVVAANVAQYDYMRHRELERFSSAQSNKAPNQYDFKSKFFLSDSELENLILLDKYEHFEWFVRVLTL